LVIDLKEKELTDFFILNILEKYKR